MIDDLTSEFLQYYTERDSRPKVDDYGVYFMGQMTVSKKDNAIVDGQ